MISHIECSWPYPMMSSTAVLSSYLEASASAEHGNLPLLRNRSQDCKEHIIRVLQTWQHFLEITF